MQQSWGWQSRKPSQPVLSIRLTGNFASPAALRTGLNRNQRSLGKRPAGPVRHLWNDRPGPGVGAVMTTVGIIGSGMIGGTVGRLSVAAGHHVVLSNSRGPETLAELVAELGPLAAAGTPYGPFTDEAGTPASAAEIRADLTGAHR